ncbi:MAG: transporter suffix domain-containing protein [Opitutaceae bacterium]
MLLKIGVILMFASALPWLAMPVAAWLAPTAGAKAAWSTGLFIAAEILFWGGVLLAGRDVWKSAREAGWKRVIPELWRKLREPARPSQGGSNDSGG